MRGKEIVEFQKGWQHEKVADRIGWIPDQLSVCFFGLDNSSWTEKLPSVQHKYPGGHSVCKPLCPSLESFFCDNDIY